MQQSTANNIDKGTIEGDNNNTIDDDKKQHKQNIKTTLDVAFVLDCTGSMNPYIESCKDNILSISSKINDQCDNCDVQFALVSYRDIPPQDHTFVTKILNFTPIPFRIQIELEKLSAAGGGDQPEALTSALYACYKNLKWRPESIKIIIVITDAPPHGLEKHVTDGFPDGDIDTFNAVEIEGKNSLNSLSNKYLNVIEIIKSIRQDLKAVIYSVACEPDLSCNNDFANDFMQFMAQYTKGKFLPLSSATLLPDVIVGSVKQQINLNNLTYKLDAEIQKIKAEYGNNISSAEINKIIMTKWKNEGIKKKDISIGTLYKTQRSKYNINLLMNQQKIKSLKDFKVHCKLFKRLKESDFRHLNVETTPVAFHPPMDSNINVETIPISPKINMDSNEMFCDNCNDMTAADELNSVDMDGKELGIIFDKFIDVYGNGDVDMYEWLLGMQKLNVELTQMEQKKVFNVMDKNDGGYIEKNDFVMFVTNTFDNVVDKADNYVVFGYVRNVKMSIWMEVIEIILSYYCMNQMQELQAKILDNMRKQNVHLLHYRGRDWNDWNNLGLLERDMVRSPMGVVQTCFNGYNGMDISVPILSELSFNNININNDQTPAMSPACAPQRVYSREASLSFGDMEHFMDRLNIVKSEYD